MFSAGLLVGLAISLQVHAQVITPAPKLPRGVIRVDLVDEFGNPSDYKAPLIGVDTEIYQDDITTTKWIGHDEAYLTMTTITTTVDNVPTPVESKVNVAIVTATAEAAGVAVGDISIMLSQELRKKLGASVDEAVALCNVVPKRARRAGDDFMSCFLDWASDAARGGGKGGSALDLVNPSVWETLGVEIAEGATGKLREVFLALGETEKAKFAVYVAAAMTVASFVNFLNDVSNGCHSHPWLGAGHVPGRPLVSSISQPALYF